MEDLFGINARRQAVAENIEKAMTVGFTPDEELEKALGAGYDPNGEDGNVEKAHQVGDIHPNGKWVWTQLPSGKYDWRTIKKNADNSKEVDDFMDKIKTFNSKYTDESKVTVKKTPKGNWDVSYSGVRLGIINADQLSEKTAKDKGWLQPKIKDLTKQEKEERKKKINEAYKKFDKEFEDWRRKNDYSNSDPEFYEKVNELYEKYNTKDTPLKIDKLTYYAIGGAVDASRGWKIEKYVEGRQKGMNKKEARKYSTDAFEKTFGKW